MSDVDEREEFRAHIRWSPQTRGTTASTSRKIAGTAIVYGQVADRLGFAERIERGALTEALRTSDPFLVYGHDDLAILARESAGSLVLTDTAEGVKIEAEVVRTTVGDDVLELIRSGHLTEMSFAMSDIEDRWEGDCRVIERIGHLWECSVVPLGAYSQTSVEGRSVPEIERTVELMRARRKLTTKARSSYGPDSEHSFFRDVATRDAHAKAVQDARGDPVLRGKPREPSFYGGDERLMRDGGLEGALRRLKGEERAQSTVLGNLGEFVPQAGSLPGFVATEFVVAVRNASMIPAAMRVEQLPASGFSVTTPRFGTGSAVTIDVEGAAVADVDPTTTLMNSPIGVASGSCDVSRQVAERALGGALDTMIASELGAALGERLDFELINGPGTGQRILGLASVVQGTSVTYTSGAPTVALLESRLGLLAANSFVTNGAPLDSMLIHPVLGYWAATQADLQGATVQPHWPVPNVTMTAQVPTTISGNQTTVWLWKRDESPLFGEVRHFRATEEEMSGTMTLRFQIDGYFAAAWNRRTASIARLSGTGLVHPATFA